MKHFPVGGGNISLLKGETSPCWRGKHLPVEGGNIHLEVNPDSSEDHARMIRTFSSRTNEETSYSFLKEHWLGKGKSVTLKTLDTIQGDECDHTIISLGRHKRAGFLNQKRINVALTRAKHLTIVIGHKRAIADCIPLNKIETLANKANFVITI